MRHEWRSWFQEVNHFLQIWFLSVTPGPLKGASLLNSSWLTSSLCVRPCSCLFTLVVTSPSVWNGAALSWQRASCAVILAYQPQLLPSAHAGSANYYCAPLNVAPKKSIVAGEPTDVQHFCQQECESVFHVFSMLLLFQSCLQTPSCVPAAVRGQRQPVDQPPDAQPADGRKPDAGGAHAGVALAILQLLVWHHSSGAVFQTGSPFSQAFLYTSLKSGNRSQCMALQQCIFRYFTLSSFFSS